MSLSISKNRAPWRKLLESHLEQTKSYDFTIATVGYDSKGNPVPRVRTCGFRGFFPELELHPSGQEDMDQQVEGGGNPGLFESDILTFTTDVRMEKLDQLASTGNYIEAMFWLKEVMVQWRIKGKAYSVGSPNPESGSEFGLRPELFEALRVKENHRGGSSGDANKWTWEKAITKYFANHSPVMRGTSCLPFCSGGWLLRLPFLPQPETLATRSPSACLRFNCSLLNQANKFTRLLQKPTSWSA